MVHASVQCLWYMLPCSAYGAVSYLQCLWCSVLSAVPVVHAYLQWMSSSCRLVTALTNSVPVHGIPSTLSRRQGMCCSTMLDRQALLLLRDDMDTSSGRHDRALFSQCSTVQFSLVSAQYSTGAPRYRRKRKQARSQLGMVSGSWWVTTHAPWENEWWPTSHECVATLHLTGASLSIVPTCTEAACVATLHLMGASLTHY